MRLRVAAPQARASPAGPVGAVAGWGSHPLESAAFSRRTRQAVIPWASQLGGSYHSRLTAKQGPGAQSRLNDISVLSKSRYGRSFNGDKAVIARMSAI